MSRRSWSRHTPGVESVADGEVAERAVGRELQRRPAQDRDDEETGGDGLADRALLRLRRETLTTCRRGTHGDGRRRRGLDVGPGGRQGLRRGDARVDSDGGLGNRSPVVAAEVELAERHAACGRAAPGGGGHRSASAAPEAGPPSSKSPKSAELAEGDAARAEPDPNAPASRGSSISPKPPD